MLECCHANTLVLDQRKEKIRKFQFLLKIGVFQVIPTCRCFSQIKGMISGVRLHRTPH